MLRNKKYGMGGAVQSFSSPMLAQGMQGGLSGFGTSGLQTFAKGGRMSNVEMSRSSIKDWYKKNYKTDELGDEINPNVTFDDLFEAILNGSDIYSIIGVHDSVVRERLFSKLSKLKGRYENYANELYLKYGQKPLGSYAKGGEIVDQYEGRTPADIWFNLSKSQRRHLLLDHANIPSGEISMYVGYDTNYDDLPHFVKQIVKKHFAEGQYARGGKLSPAQERAFFDKTKTKYTQSDANQLIGNYIEIYAQGQDKPIASAMIAKATIDSKFREKTLVIELEGGTQERIPEDKIDAFFNGSNILLSIPSKGSFYGLKLKKQAYHYAKGGQAEEKFFAVTKIKVQPIKSVSLWKNRISTQEPTRENILEFLQNVPKDERICIYITDIEKLDGELHSAYIPLYTNGAESVEQIVDSEGNVIWNLYPKKTFAKGGEITHLPEARKVSKEDIEQFIRYVDSFYGKNGVYADNYEGFNSKAQIRKAVMTYLNNLSSQQTWGGGAGDSLDRERVAQILKPSSKPTYANGGDIENRNRFASARTMGRDSQNWEQELKEYAGEHYKSLTPREREEIIADMQKSYDINTHFAKGGKISSYEVELEAVPNRDFSYGSHEAKVRVKKSKKSANSIEQAVAITKQFIQENDLGGSNFIPAKIYKNGKHIGFISYNGRVWNNDQSEMKFAEGGKMNQKPSKYNIGDKVFTFYNPSKLASIIDVYFKAWDKFGGLPHENDTYFYELSLPNGEKKTLAESALSSTPLQSEKAVYKSEEPKFIEYKGSEIMYEPTMKKYYANDVEFNSLKDAQKFLDSGKTSRNIRGAYQRGLFADGGETSSRNKEIAQTILNQIGGINRLVAFTGAYNFVAINNGVSFRIKNPKANYIKITLNGKDLYDLEVGRIRGTDYKVIGEQSDLYYDMLKSEIEKFTGMYLSFAKGGMLDKYEFIDSITDIYKVRSKWFAYGKRYGVEKKGVGYTKKEALENLDLHLSYVTSKDEFAQGGKISFEGLANKVAKRYVGKKVSKEYQAEYGKTYDAKEAKEVGNKVAGKVYQQQVAKKKIVRKLQRKTN